MPEQFSADNLFAEDSQNFGIQKTQFIEDEEDPIFGGPSANTDPAEVTPIPKETKQKPAQKKEEVKSQDQDTDDTEEEETNEITLFGDEEDEDETEGNLESKKDKGEKKGFKKAEKPAEETPSETTEDNTFSVLAEELTNLGVFTLDEDEEAVDVKDGEALRDRFFKEIQKQTQNYLYNQILEPFGQEGADMFEAIFINGVHPTDYLQSFAQLENLSEMNLEEEGTQEQVVREYYRQLGWKQDRINSKVEKLKSTADLEEEAQTVHEKLIENQQEQHEALIKQAEQRRQAQLQYKQQQLNSFNTILKDKLKTKEFDGIPVTEKTAKETIQYLFEERYQTASGEKLTEFDKDILDLRKPENYETRVKLALLLKNKLDLSKVKTTAVTKETNKLFDKLVNKDKVTKRVSPFSTSEEF